MALGVTSVWLLGDSKSFPYKKISQIGRAMVYYYRGMSSGSTQSMRDAGDGKMFIENVSKGMETRMVGYHQWDPF